METLISPAVESPTYVIDGNKVTTWPELVKSINSFIPDSDWQGNSLDALDDILYGGYGTPNSFVVIWKASDISHQSLGYEATKDYYKQLPEFEQLYQEGHIKTLFDTVVDIFKNHDNIELRLE